MRPRLAPEATLSPPDRRESLLEATASAAEGVADLRPPGTYVAVVPKTPAPPSREADDRPGGNGRALVRGLQLSCCARAARKLRMRRSMCPCQFVWID